MNLAKCDGITCDTDHWYYDDDHNSRLLYNDSGKYYCPSNHIMGMGISMVLCSTMENDEYVNAVNSYQSSGVSIFTEYATCGRCNVCNNHKMIASFSFTKGPYFDSICIEWGCEYKDDVTNTHPSCNRFKFTNELHYFPVIGSNECSCTCNTKIYDIYERCLFGECSDIENNGVLCNPSQ